jgi:hypothetical protein
MAAMVSASRTGGKAEGGGGNSRNLAAGTMLDGPKAYRLFSPTRERGVWSTCELKLFIVNTPV